MHTLHFSLSKTNREARKPQQKSPAYGVNLEGVVEASLVAADARVDARHVASCGFVHDLWVRQKRPSHGDQIRVAVG
jgi:hypothetical protein